MNRRRPLGFAALVALSAISAGCSLALDFDDIEGLPCDCLPDFLCLPSSQTCVPANSVDDFKSCDLDVVQADEQCRSGRSCVDILGRGPRCLPTCTPLNPFVSDVGRLLGEQCGAGQFCWDVGGRGFCDEGQCNDLPDDCPPPERCVRINGAGVCFATCDILSPNQCGPTSTHCQPVAESRTMACLRSGPQAVGQPCGLNEGACAPTDDDNRRLICTRPVGSTDPLRRCSPVCNVAAGNADCFRAGETCFEAIGNIDSVGTDLGVCLGGG